MNRKRKKISFRSDRGMKNAVGKSGKGGQGLALQCAHACAAAWCHSQLAAGGRPVLREGWHFASPCAPHEPAMLRAATPGTRAGCGPSLIQQLGAAGLASALGLDP